MRLQLSALVGAAGEREALDADNDARQNDQVKRHLVPG